ncbi:SAV_915 family protein [Haloechinothrix salitolerans]|uniref:SAV_915 family protein n=1 Tax=Haloechinothrix salitolerans TaxID=926830 RepID=A0ABW2BX85_9PSEU
MEPQRAVERHRGVMSDSDLEQPTAGTPVREFPPFVYLPCSEHVSNPEDAVLELRQTRDGRTALLVYSALDRLKTCCGDQQPWMIMPTELLNKLYQTQPFDLLLLDVIVPEEFRSGGGSHDRS